MELIVSREDADTFLGAAYRFDVDEASQIQALRDAFARLSIAGEYTMAFAWRADENFAVDHLSTFSPEVESAFWAVKAAASREYSLAMLHARPAFGEGLDHYSGTRSYRKARQLGQPGFCGMLCPTHTGHVVTVGSPQMGARAGIHSRALDQIAAHLAAAWRLRKRLAAPDAFEENAEATFHPSGRLQDAVGPAKNGDVRQRLRNLVIAREKALGGKGERLQLWPALLGGRYTVIDRFDGSGARYVVAHQNPATAADLARLSGRERQVVEGVAAGKLEKALAIDLGVSESHISKVLHRALRRLGLSSAIDLALVASCSDSVTLDDEVLGKSIVAAFRLQGPAADALVGLTPAERAIAADILRGLSNREIAARRNRSQRTIANQVASVLDKMKVPTRRALAANLSRI